MRKQSTISKLPIDETQDDGCGPLSEQDEELALELINRGGKSGRPHAGRAPKRPLVRISLRLSPAVARRIETAVVDREDRPSRHTWLVEAIMAQLKRQKC